MKPCGGGLVGKVLAEQGGGPKLIYTAPMEKSEHVGCAYHLSTEEVQTGGNLKPVAQLLCSTSELQIQRETQSLKVRSGAIENIQHG